MGRVFVISERCRIPSYFFVSSFCTFFLQNPVGSMAERGYCRKKRVGFSFISSKILSAVRDSFPPLIASKMPSLLFALIGRRFLFALFPTYRRSIAILL